MLRDLSPLSPASCVHSVVPIVPCPTSKVHKSGRVERAMERELPLCRRRSEVAVEREKGDVDVNVNQRQSGDERANVAPRSSHFRSPLSLLTLPVDPDAADADAHFSRVGTDQGKHPRPSGLNQDQIRCT